MATTTRLPDELKTEAEAYAQGLGVSLNALMAFALRDYLDRRKFVEWKAAQASAQAAGAATDRQPVTWKPPKNPRAQCPCGSGQQYRHCHGRVPVTS
jgi:predicted transcriptional regulator